MIKSILDNDLYKFTMQQAVHALYPWAQVQYRFINRDNTNFPKGFDERLKSAVKEMSKLKLADSEEEYLKDVCYFMTPVYIDFLKNYRFDPNEVLIEQHDGKLELSIKGPWYRTILWEVPLMALISEIYFEITNKSSATRDELKNKNTNKAKKLKNNHVHFADFGTRRRFSSKNQDAVIGDLLEVKENTLVGTSNVYFAKKHAIKPIGTHAHEWFMFHVMESGYRLANKVAIDAWASVYKGNLGIALTDTFTTDEFLSIFDAAAGRLFDGVRQDSGDPFLFVDKLVDHYKKLRIAPLTKTIVFSDALNTDKAIELQKYCEGKINASFGIGTHLTNDVGVKALNIVIKMSHCRNTMDCAWYPVIKLSDDKGKHTGDPEEIELCKRALKRSGQ